MRIPPARTLAAAGTAGAGAATGAAAYLIVGGLPGVLYAAGICLACIFGAVAIAAGRAEQAREPGPDVEIVPRRPRWRRKKHILAELEATSAELEEHRQALANLGAQLAREAEAAHQNALRLESQIQQLETERDALKELISRERERFEQTLDELGGGIGRHGNELAELERELEALIAR